jgi:HEAT repeats
MTRITEYFDDKHYGVSGTREKLTAADLRKLAAIAGGKVAGATFGERVKAAGALGARGGAADRQMLRALVADAREEPRVRTAAAAALGERGSRDAEAGLLACLDVEDPIVLAQVVKSLGHIGAGPSLQALQKMGYHRARLVNQQRDLAMMLIAYRSRVDLEGDPIPFKATVRRAAGAYDRLLKTSVRQISGKTVSDVLERHRTRRYALELSAEHAFEIAMGSGRLVLLLTRKVTRKALLGVVFERRVILGLGVELHRETGTYATRFIMFARPEGPGAARLMGVRADGQPTLAGDLARMPDGLSFVLSDVERPGTAPMRIEGTLSARGVRVDASVVSGRRLAKRRTFDVVVPRPR